MKHYILLSVAIPPQESEREQYKVWRSFLFDNPTTTKLSPSIERLAENVWLFDRGDCVSTFCQIVSDAGKVGLICRIQFLEGDDA